MKHRVYKMKEVVKVRYPSISKESRGWLKTWNTKWHRKGTVGRPCFEVWFQDWMGATYACVAWSRYFEEGLCIIPNTQQREWRSYQPLQDKRWNCHPEKWWRTLAKYQWSTAQKTKWEVYIQRREERILPHDKVTQTNELTCRWGISLLLEDSLHSLSHWYRFRGYSNFADGKALKLWLNGASGCKPSSCLNVFRASSLTRTITPGTTPIAVGIRTLTYTTWRCELDLQEGAATPCATAVSKRYMNDINDMDTHPRPVFFRQAKY